MNTSHSLKSFFKLLSQYGSTSLFATVLDFGVFQLALSFLGASVFGAFLCGRTIGRTTSFIIHTNWVFHYIEGLLLKPLLVNYFIGILVGTILNLGGVYILNNYVGLSAWPSRIITATTVWFIVFTYNRLWVFKKKDELSNKQYL